MSVTKITFNGRDYASPDEMPPDVRRAYDQVVAGVAASNPEVAQALTSGNVRVRTTTRFIVNGKEYPNVEAMPEAVRAAYQSAMSGGGSQVPTTSIALGPTATTGRSRATRALLAAVLLWGLYLLVKRLAG